MSAEPFPPVAELLPHSGCMVWLSRILTHTADATTCAVDIEERTMLRGADGHVPSWVGVEYMAQCIAAHGGLLSRARGEPQKRGFLVSVRKAIFHTPYFAIGQTLEVHARHVRGQRGLLTFDCAIHDGVGGDALAMARVNVYIGPDSPAAAS